ncbi:phospholipase-like protein [Tanacetum coccineum]
MATRLSHSSVKQLADEAMDVGKKLLQLPSLTAEIINILADVEQILFRVQQSPSRLVIKALAPIITALVAKELLIHPDVDVNISVACCICDVLTIMTPYNHEQMKEFFQLVVVTFEKLTSTRGGCYTKMMKVLETLSSVQFMELMSECLHLDGLIVRLFKQFISVADSNSSAVVSKMEQIMTMIMWESKDLDELAGLLTTSVKKDGQIASPVSCHLGEKVLNNCAARLSKPHRPYLRLRRCQNSEGEKKRGKYMLSSSDPPMPSKAVKELNGKRKRDDKKAQSLELRKCRRSPGGKLLVQSVEHGENLVGERIKVWWPLDKKYYEGVVESFDCSEKKHTVSYDDGDVEHLVLKEQRWELVRKLVVELPVIVSSPQTGVTCVQGYTVKNINAPILESIFKKHGDIAATCVFKTSSVRESILEVVCEVVRKIQTSDVTAIISDMEELLSQVSGAEAIKLNVAWLRAHLEAIHKTTEAKKKCSLLMKMNANTSLVRIAAETDLKEILSELTTVQERFEKAKRCVEALNLVKKKLDDNFLESKSEKDSWVEHPML